MAHEQDSIPALLRGAYQVVARETFEQHLSTGRREASLQGPKNVPCQGGRFTPLALSLYRIGDPKPIYRLRAPDPGVSGGPLRLPWVSRPYFCPLFA